MKKLLIAFITLPILSLLFFLTFDINAVEKSEKKAVVEKKSDVVEISDSKITKKNLKQDDLEDEDEVESFKAKKEKALTLVAENNKDEKEIRRLRNQIVKRNKKIKKLGFHLKRIKKTIYVNELSSKEEKKLNKKIKKSKKSKKRKPKSLNK